MKQKQTGQQNAWLSKCLVGLAVSCISALVVALIGAIMVLNGTLSIDTMNTLAAAIQFVATFLGVLCVSKMVKERKLAASLVVVLSYYFILISCTILFWNGQFDGIIPGVLSGVLGGSIAFLINIKQKTAKRGYIRKGHSR